MAENTLNNFQEAIEAISKDYKGLEKALSEQLKKYNTIEEKNIDDLTEMKIKSFERLCSENIFNFYANRVNDSNYFPFISENIEEIVAKYGQSFNEYEARESEKKLTPSEANFIRKEYSKFSHFLDKLLRVLQTNGSGKLKQSLSPQNPTAFEEAMAMSFLGYAIKSISMGHLDTELALRLIDIVQQYPDTIGPEFSKSIKMEKIPCWIFLKWLPLMMHIFNSPCAPYFQPLFDKILNLYPDAIIYPFFTTYDDFDEDDKSQNARYIKEFKDQFQDKFSPTNEFIIQLNNLTYPEHRCKYFFDLLNDIIQTERTNPSIAIPKFTKVLDKMYEELFQADRLSGSYNKEFGKKYSNYKKIFGERFRGMLDNLKNNPGILKQQLDKEIAAISDAAPKRGGEDKLDKFSDWLARFEGNEKIEIPGQYQGNKEPIRETNITISSFDKTVLILSSIRKPKRLVIYGSDAKKYMFLVKGIEDIRLDQRIEQLFSFMNDIFKNDPTCYSKELSLATYLVIPMTKKLGILEWVPNTKPLREIMEEELIKTEPGASLDLKPENQIVFQRGKWFRDLVQSI